MSRDCSRPAEHPGTGSQGIDNGYNRLSRQKGPLKGWDFWSISLNQVKETPVQSDKFVSDLLAPHPNASPAAPLTLTAPS
eukprot:6278320-Amphidinium_carterae.1